jgi:hypothetical protein
MSAKETKSKSNKIQADQWLRLPRLSQPHPEALKLVTTIDDILKCNPQACNDVGVGTGALLKSLRDDTKRELNFVCSRASGGRFVGLQLVTILLHCSQRKYNTSCVIPWQDKALPIWRRWKLDSQTCYVDAGELHSVLGMSSLALFSFLEVVHSCGGIACM